MAPLGKLVRFSGGRIGGSMDDWMQIGGQAAAFFDACVTVRRQIFSGRGGLLFLQGFLRKRGAKTWFFDGEIVVERW
jgi:hypothetical protein